MKKVILVLLLTVAAHACLPPLKPLPPLGCNYSNAMLITTQNNTCYWVYVNCN